MSEPGNPEENQNKGGNQGEKGTERAPISKVIQDRIEKRNRIDPTFQKDVETFTKLINEVGPKRAAELMALYKYYGHTDTLTELDNRAGFEIHMLEKIEQMHDDYISEGVDPNSETGDVVIIYGDVDNLKMNNDLNGHLSGDISLIAVGEALSRPSESNDYSEEPVPEYEVARLGGDEFGIGLVGKKDVSRKDQIIEQVNKNLDKARKDGLIPDYMGLSIGIAHKRQNEKLDDLIDRAEAGMRAAKDAVKKAAGERGGHLSTIVDLDKPEEPQLPETGQ